MMNPATPLLGLLVAAVLGFVLVYPARRLAIAWRAVDTPDHRKIHKGIVPRLGGLAVALAIAIALVVLMVADPQFRHEVSVAWSPAFLAGSAIAVVFAVGFVDDLTGIGPKAKFVIECVAAVLLLQAIGGLQTVQLVSGGPVYSIGGVGTVFGIIWMVALTNAVNMVDVADGVATATSAIAALALGGLAWRLGSPLTATLAISMAGALAGFLPQNLKHRMFLGDSGSLPMGFALGAISLAGVRADGTVLVLPMILAVSLPITELVLTLARRALVAMTVVRPQAMNGRFVLETGRFGFFTADRRHIAHRLLDLGLPLPRALGMLACTALLFGTLAIITTEWPSMSVAATVLLGATVLYAAPRWLYEELRLIDRGTFLPFLESVRLRSRLTLLAVDTLLVTVAWIAAAALERTMLSRSMFALGIAGTMVGFRVAGLYRGSYRHASLAEVARGVRAIAVGALVGMTLVQVIPNTQEPPAFWIINTYLLLTLVLGARLSFRILEYGYHRGQGGGRRAAILGTDHSSALALRDLLASPGHELRPVAFVEAFSLRSVFDGYPVVAVHAETRKALDAFGVTDLVVPDTVLHRTLLGALRAQPHISALRVVWFAVRFAPADDEGAA